MQSPLSVRRMLVTLTLILLGALVTRPALADEATCGAHRPWVLVDISGTQAGFAERLIGDLRAGLAPTRIDACVSGVEGKAPLATVKIASARSQAYSIDVSDSVTQKRIGRDIDLAHVPPDGHAFALAVAAEELLRASWAELALARNRKPPPEEPAPIVAAPPLPPSGGPDALAAPRRPALGLGLGFERYGGGQTHFGADLIWLQPLAPFLSLGIQLGGRRGLSVEAPDGSITASAAGVELSLRPQLLHNNLLRLDGILSVRTFYVWFHPHPIAGAASKTEASYALFGRLGVSLSLGRPGSLQGLFSAGLGAPFRAFSASDGGQVVTGVSELEVFAGSGVALPL